MALLLCHECYFWVPPRNGRCPECDHGIDSGSPDPSADALDRVVGSALRPLGGVHMPRRLLPERGTLYETANGLYFLPHVMLRRLELVERTEAGRSLMWTLASVAFAPLILVLPFLRFRKLTQEEVPVFEPAPLPDPERDQLGRRLLENPGAFFVPRKSIRRLKRRRGRWIIERRVGRKLKLRPEHDNGQLGEEMFQLLQQDVWRHIDDA